jgi:uncharacterized protein
MHLTSRKLASALLLALLACVAHAQQIQRIQSLKDIRERGVIMQQWESSCAAAALATVLTYGFRDAVSERRVAADMLERTDPEKVRTSGGFSMLDMKRFVEARGYKGSAYKDLSLDELKLFHAPIVPINRHGYNHYVVFNGVQGGTVHVADPAFGNYEMPIARFTAMWLDGLAFTVNR